MKCHLTPAAVMDARPLPLVQGGSRRRSERRGRTFAGVGGGGPTSPRIPLLYLLFLRPLPPPTGSFVCAAALCARAVMFISVYLCLSGAFRCIRGVEPSAAVAHFEASEIEKSQLCNLKNILARSHDPSWEKVNTFKK